MEPFGGFTNPLVNGITNTPGAFLFLYSNRNYCDQVLRPFIYGFDESMVDMLLAKGDTLAAAYARPDVASSTAVANAIKPDPMGCQLDMRTFSALWTFMLVINQPNNYTGSVVAADGMRSTVLCGHCIGEPIAPNTMMMSTPVINRDCQLVVHSRQILTNGGSSGSAYGMRMRPPSVACTEDIVDASLNASAPNKDLYLMTPYNVLTNYEFNGTPESVVSTPGMCMLQNLKERQPIQSTLKTPGIHLKQILQGLDMQNATEKSAEMSPRGIGGMDELGMMAGCGDDCDRYKAGVANQLSNMSIGSHIQTSGIDTSSVFSIGMVEAVYPNMTVIPQRVADQPVDGMGRGMEIIPQTICNPKVIYSSFCSSAVSSLAADCGLSGISFAYTSHDPIKHNELDKSTFQVIERGTALICPNNDPVANAQMLRASVDMFRVLFSKNVAPFITGVLGDFEIRAEYQCNGETHVDLQLLDFGMNTNLGSDCWFEAPNRLSGVTTTALGSEQAFDNNGQMINQLVLQTQGKTQMGALGIPAFPSPGVSPMVSPAPVAPAPVSTFGF